MIIFGDELLDIKPFDPHAVMQEIDTLSAVTVEDMMEAEQNSTNENYVKATMSHRNENTIRTSIGYITI